MVGLPAVRNAFPQQIAQQIVSVQPMGTPKGVTYYMDEIYEKNKYKRAWNKFKRLCQFGTTKLFIGKQK